MFIYCICTQYLVEAPFALITASIRRGMEVISLWHCWGGMEAQVSLTVAFSSSALLGTQREVCDLLTSWIDIIYLENKQGEFPFHVNFKTVFTSACIN